MFKCSWKRISVLFGLFQDQYAFIYKALLESVKKVGTIIPAAQFSKAFAKLQKKRGRALAEQFALLSEFDPQQPAASLGSVHSEDNVHKSKDVSLAISKNSLVL